VVFDNYHEVPEGSSFHELLLNGLSRTPEGINAILISRSDPPPALIRLRANHQMEVLGWDELRLTPRESAAIVRLRGQQKMSKDAVQHLHTLADGWAAGLVLMLESVHRGIEPQLMGKFTPEEMMDYFGNELFDKTDKEIQGFLLKTAFLPKMTAKMAEELTNLSSAGSILSSLYRNNYFTGKRLQVEPVYQYHPLFREFLLLRARDLFSPEELSLIQGRAATILEESGQIEDAAEFFHQASDWEGFTRLILKQAQSLIIQGRNRSLEEWLSSLPKDVIDNNPWLLYWMGEAILPFNPNLARSYFERAFERFKTQEDLDGIFRAWSGTAGSIMAAMEDFELLDQWISLLEDLMHRFMVFPSEEIKARVVSTMFQALVFRQPHHPEIEAWENQALTCIEDHETIDEKVMGWARLIYYRIFLGDFAKAAQYIDSLRQFTQSIGILPRTLIRVKFSEAIYYRYTGLHEKCLKAVSDGLELSSRSGAHYMDHFLLQHGIGSALNVNDTETAGKLMEKMTFLNRFKPWDKWAYHRTQSRSALLQRDVKKAPSHIELAFRFGLDVGAPLSMFYCHLAKSYVSHQLGNDREAGEHLSRASGIANQMKSQLFKFFVLLAKALFAFDQGDEGLGMSSLREALSLGKEGRFFCTNIDQPSSMVRLFTKALEAGIEVNYVQELIRRLNIIPAEPPLHLDNWPWPLKIFTLGRFEILKDGKPIRFSRKGHQKPLSMLKALIAFGGREVREEEIADALWPEADGDTAHMSFVTTLHRLRQLLGHEKFIQRRENRLTLDERYCWADVWAFEHILRKAEAQWLKRGMASAIPFIEKAMEMYRGPFLAQEVEQPWTMSMSERLKTKFLRNVEKLGLYWQQADQWERALDCYQKGLEVDDLSEEFYQGLMVCYHQLDQKAKALSVYNRCRKKLSTALGIQPSAKTQSMYKSLIS